MTPLADALRDASAANLLERLGDGIVRLQPVVRDFVLHGLKRDWCRGCESARRRLIDYYEDVAKLEGQCAERGIDAVVRDLGSALAFQWGRPKSRTITRIGSLRRALQKEQHVLRDWRHDQEPAFLAQQLAKRAAELRLPYLVARARERLAAHAAPYFSLLWRTGMAPLLSLMHKEQVVTDCAILRGRGCVLTVTHGGPLRKWDLETGELSQSAFVRESGAKSIAASPDGRTAIIGIAGGAPILWDVVDWQPRFVLEAEGGPNWSVDLSSDGSRALTITPYGPALWDSTIGRQLKKVGGRKDCLNAIAFTPDDKGAVFGVSGAKWYSGTWKREGVVLLVTIEAGYGR